MEGFFQNIRKGYTYVTRLLISLVKGFHVIRKKNEMR